MATYVNKGTGSNASSGNLNITKPVGLAVGDLMYCFMRSRASSGSPSLTTPTGWTLLQTSGTPTGSGLFYSLWKIADAADVAASTFTFPLTNSVASDGQIERWINPDPVSPITASNSATQASGTTVTATTITPTAKCKLVIHMGQQSTTKSYSGYASANNNPSWTEAYDGSSGDSSVAMAYGAYPFTTATGNVSGVTSLSGDTSLHVAAITDAPAITVSAVAMALSLIRPSLPIGIRAPLRIALTLVAPVVAAFSSKWNNAPRHDTSWENEPRHD